MSTLNSSLTQIERGLGLLRRTSVLRLLREPATAPEVRGRLSHFGLEPTSDLLELYSWHDGTDVGKARSLDEAQLFPGFYMLALDDACVNLQSFRGDARWGAGWLPIFANGGGDFYVVDLVDLGQVRHFRLEQSEHPVEFESVGAMATTIAAAFSDGVFFVDEDGYLEMDDESFAELAARVNPRVQWWTD